MLKWIVAAALCLAAIVAILLRHSKKRGEKTSKSDMKAYYRAISGMTGEHPMFLPVQQAMEDAMDEGGFLSDPISTIRSSLPMYIEIPSGNDPEKLSKSILSQLRSFDRFLKDFFTTIEKYEGDNPLIVLLKSTISTPTPEEVKKFAKKVFGDHWETVMLKNKVNLQQYFKWEKYICKPFCLKARIAESLMNKKILESDITTDLRIQKDTTYIVDIFEGINKDIQTQCSEDERQKGKRHCSRCQHNPKWVKKCFEEHYFGGEGISSPFKP